MKSCKKRIAVRQRSYRPGLEILESRDLLTAGALDPTFGAGGRVTTEFGAVAYANAVAMQPDDKIVVAGSTAQYFDGFDNDFAVARYNPDGTLDNTFGFLGRLTTDVINNSGDSVQSLAIQSDGKIVAAGVAAGANSGMGLVRYNPDGTLDSTFGVNGKEVPDLPGHTFSPSSMTIANGWIWVAGSVNFEEFGLTRFDMGGNMDHAFGDNGLAFAHFGIAYDDVRGNAMAVQSNGQIVIAGTAEDIDLGAKDVVIARFNTDGTLDESFGPGGTVTTTLGNPADARAVAIQSDGGIVVAGRVSTYVQNFGDVPVFLLLRYLPVGRLDTSFGAQGIVTTDFVPSHPGSPAFDIVNGLAIQSDGKILAAGWSDLRFALARYRPDGSLDPNFGDNGRVATEFGWGMANAITLQADGKIVLAGLSQFGITPNHLSQPFAVARYNAFGTFAMTKIASALNIFGTATADQLDVRDDGAGNITVSSRREDAPPFELHGIHHIKIDTGGGDDAVTYHLGGSVSPLPAFRPADVEFAMGRGNDSLEILLDPSRFGRDGMITADMGAGDDLFRVQVPPSVPDTTPPPDPDFLPGLSIAVQGGPGNDTFVTFVGSEIDPESLPCPTCIEAKLNFNYEGNGGSDRFFTDVANVALDGPITMMMAGGQGEDLSQTNFANVDVNATLTLVNDGGDGADQVQFGCAWQVSAGASTLVNLIGGQGPDAVMGVAGNYIAVDARSTYNFDGGAGDDFLAFSYVNAMVAGTFDLSMTGGLGDDTLAAMLQPGVMSSGVCTATLDGGRGNDALTAILVPAVQRGGLFAASLEGNDGNDTLVADVPPGPCAPGSMIDVFLRGGDGNDFIFVNVDLTGFTPESGRLRVAVDGGKRSDHLTFLVTGADRTMENALFTLDGGLGEDLAVVSPIVHVMNCEHVKEM